MNKVCRCCKRNKNCHESPEDDLCVRKMAERSHDRIDTDWNTILFLFVSAMVGLIIIGVAIGHYLWR